MAGTDPPYPASNKMNFPRLIYIGDVPIQHTVAGSTLLFRNLQMYPPEKLLICELAEVSTPNRRLSRANYVHLPLGARHLAHTRFAGISSVWRQASTRSMVKKVIRVAQTFHPEAVLTVAHGWSWHTAALVAKKLKLPLHLIVHDHPPLSCDLPKALQFWTERRFQKIYQLATSRLGISPWMENYYRGKYGVAGSYLFPTRAADAPVYVEPPKPRAGKPFTVGFAGTITDGYAKALRTAANVLQPLGGQILIYSGVNEKWIARLGLGLPNISIRPVVPYRQLLEELRTKADLLFLPLSFSPADHIRMITSFQSKLADYTITGLPILIYGPEYASAVRWARQNQGVAEVVDTENAEALATALLRLRSDDALRGQLGKKSSEVGARIFSGETAASIFADHLYCRGNKTADPQPERRQ